MIPFAGPNWFIFPHNRYVQSTGFNRGLLAFGDFTPPYSQANRSLSFATYTETVHTNMSTTNRIQPMPCASPTHVYQLKGYTSGGYTSQCNKQQAFTNTETTLTISFATERRGGCYPMPHFQRSRMYYAGGYSDSLGQYRTDITYVTQNTETSTTVGAVTSTSQHMGGAFFTRVEAYFYSGYTSGGGATNLNTKFTFSNDTSAGSTSDGYGSRQNPVSFSSDVYGYGIQGVGIGFTSNYRFTFSSATWAVSTQSPENNGQIVGGGAFANPTEGAVWGGYNSYFLKRLLYRLAWSTETYTNSSYTTADANSGFIYYHGTY